LINVNIVTDACWCSCCLILLINFNVRCDYRSYCHSITIFSLSQDNDLYKLPNKWAKSLYFCLSRPHYCYITWTYRVTPQLQLTNISIYIVTSAVKLSEFVSYFLCYGPHILNGASLLGTLTRLRAWKPRNIGSYPERNKNVSFKSFWPGGGPGAPPASFSVVPEGLFPGGGGGMMQGLEANCSPPTSVDIKNGWRYTTACAYGFMECLVGHTYCYYVMPNSLCGLRPVRERERERETADIIHKIT
jgi:hypothetical protein